MSSIPYHSLPADGEFVDIKKLLVIMDVLKAD